MSFLLGWPIFRNYVSFRKGACKGPHSPRLWCGYLGASALGDFFTYLKKTATEVRPLFCFSVWYSKNHLVSTNFRQNMFVFLSFAKKETWRILPQKMNPKFYQGDLSYRYTSYDHWFIHVMSSNESKHPTRINYNHITKTNFGCCLGIGQTCFLVGRPTHLPLQKTRHVTFKPIELMYMIRGGIFAHGFSG